MKIKVIEKEQNNKKNKMSIFETYYFDFLFVLKTFSFGKFKWVDSEILRLRKKYDICWKIIDKDGKVIERIY